MINKKLLGGLLFGTSVLVAISPLNAKEVSAKDIVGSDNVLPLTTDKVTSPVLTLKTMGQDKFSEDFRSKAYIKTDFTVYHNDPKEKVFNQKSVNLLPTGSYADVDKVELFSGETYVLLSVLGRKIGWVTEDSIAYTSYAEIESTKTLDSEKTYGIIATEQVTYDKPKPLKDSKLVKTTLPKDTVVTLIEDVLINNELSYDTWFLYKSAENEGYINISDLKNLELFGTENAKGTLRSDIVRVYKDATHTSEVVTELKSKDSKVDLFSKKLEKLSDTKEDWVKIKTTDGTETFVPKSAVNYIDYATEKEVRTVNKLGYMLEDATLMTLPTGYKDSKESVKLTKDTLVTLNNYKTVTFKGQETKWVSVSLDGAEIGYIPSDKVREVNPTEEITYTLDNNDNLESLLSEFHLTKDNFYLMNISLADKELTEGTTVRVQQEPQVYDTSNVYGSNDTVELVKELMPSVDSIKEAGLKPSVAFAQAIHESGGGTSGLAEKNNNLFGIKGTYKGEGSSWSTWEDYGNGSVTIDATFRSYPSKVESVLDYIDLITENSRYSRAVNAETPLDSITAIKNGGYATDPLYIAKVMNVIDSYDLTQFDN